jgi:hypothetical protein
MIVLALTDSGIERIIESHGGKHWVYRGKNRNKAAQFLQLKELTPLPQGEVHIIKYLCEDRHGRKRDTSDVPRDREAATGHRGTARQTGRANPIRT